MDYRVVRRYEEVKNPKINASVAIHGTPAIHVHDPEQKWKTVRTPTFRKPCVFLLITQTDKEMFRGPLWAVNWGYEKLAKYCVRCIRLDKFTDCGEEFQCHACGNVRYCSAIHRMYDWTRHKEYCEEGNFKWSELDEESTAIALGGRREAKQERRFRPDCELCFDKLKDPEEARQLLREWCVNKEQGLCGDEK